MIDVPERILASCYKCYGSLAVHYTTERIDKSTLWAGIACYPAHGFDTNEILGQAEVALGSARDWPQDRIEVAEAR